jgi:hypothetical protein
MMCIVCGAVACMIDGRQPVHLIYEADCTKQRYQCQWEQVALVGTRLRDALRTCRREAEQQKSKAKRQR